MECRLNVHREEFLLFYTRYTVCTVVSSLAVVFASRDAGLVKAMPKDKPRG